jgi:hypothetical protein
MLALETLRAHLTRPNAWGRVLVLSAFACALIVGLLAMHTIASTGGHHEPAPHASMSLETGEPNAGAGVPAADYCSGICDPDHDTAAMTCILALLVGILAIGASRRTSPGTYTQQIAASFAASAGRPSTRSLPPPDLTLLSISRT